ncbi:hypothetical protein PHISCL_10891 [Aspergillus sclerotialis]|uniref:Uncharacterized protein n=1 Tax=Aspergillus sclerotialis TaxID=2070753 RepID=A0A3A2Z0Y1_9EURO|nr:hypothetical protein PHISCL_10891 [Aspergillus sclerotialis]
MADTTGKSQRARGNAKPSENSDKMPMGQPWTLPGNTSLAAGARAWTPRSTTRDTLNSEAHSGTWLS